MDANDGGVGQALCDGGFPPNPCLNHRIREPDHFESNMLAEDFIPSFINAAHPSHADLLCQGETFAASR